MPAREVAAGSARGAATQAVRGATGETVDGAATKAVRGTRTETVHEAATRAAGGAAAVTETAGGETAPAEAHPRGALLISLLYVTLLGLLWSFMYLHNVKAG
ncbi:MAG TPA: hypothetical protein VF282_04570 [Bacillota bacterium]